ncbi:hypothetical protein [Limnovirga soli]|uniref:Uncharacterized protein n=1 Tax=Limnovirga soli TaxID=2656915 RepID=A0A8J8FEP5_9BACT|nr:hypothetical protein [Limnovirga soli]NNV55004.1 hypothetical protein [Limnovirga soli]
MSDQISDSQILKELKLRLAKLLEEEKNALIEKEIRDISIQKIKIGIEAFTQLGAPDLSIIKNQNSAESITSFSYPKDKTWQDKIKAFMKYKNTVVTISQIVDGIKEYEPAYTTEKLHAAISNIVSTMVKNNLITAYKPKEFKMKGYYYGHPLWFVDGELKNEHVPDWDKKLSW